MVVLPMEVLAEFIELKILEISAFYRTQIILSNVDLKSRTKAWSPVLQVALTTHLLPQGATAVPGHLFPGFSSCLWALGMTPTCLHTQPTTQMVSLIILGAFLHRGGEPPGDTISLFAGNTSETSAVLKFSRKCWPEKVAAN